MKVLKFLSMMAIALCVVACSDDDEEVYVVETTPAEEIEDTYTGYSYTSFAYGDVLVESGESVAVTANSDGTVDVVLTSTTWGTWTVPSATVTETTDGYTISGTGTADVSMSSSLAEKIDTRASYDCTLTATISADLSEAQFVFYASFMGGTTIVFTLGDMPAAVAIAGSHSGYTTVSSGYFSYLSGHYYDDQTVTITAEDGNETVAISYTNDTWGEFTYSGVTVTSNDDGSYTLEGEGVCAMAGHSGTATNYDATVSGTITSDGVISLLDMAVPSVMNGTTASFYEADYPAAFAVAGSYTGDMAMTVSSIDCGTVEDMAVKVTPTDEVNGIVTMTVSSFDMVVSMMSMDMTIGDIAIEGVSVTTDDNETYTVEASGLTIEGVSYTNNGTETTTTIDVTASVSGTINSDDSASITFSLTMGAMPMPVVCVYTVEAAATEE